MATFSIFSDSPVGCLQRECIPHSEKYYGIVYHYRFVLAGSQDTYLQYPFIQNLNVCAVPKPRSGLAQNLFFKKSSSGIWLSFDIDSYFQ